MIVDLLTRERGRMSFICHIPKTGKGKLRKQFFQPLTLLYIVYTERPNRNLQRFSDIRLTRPYTSIPFDAYKLAIALFVAEFLTHATRNEQRNESLFDYVESSLAWLDNVTSPFSNFHLVFMMHLTRFVGFFPNLSNDAPGMWFDLRNGAFLSSSHPTPTL